MRKQSEEAQKDDMEFLKKRPARKGIDIDELFKLGIVKRYFPSTEAQLAQRLLLMTNIFIAGTSLYTMIHGYPIGVLGLIAYLCFRYAMWRFCMVALTRKVLSKCERLEEAKIALLWISVGVAFTAAASWGNALLPAIGFFSGCISSYPSYQEMKYYVNQGVDYSWRDGLS